jgi:glucokinase
MIPKSMPKLILAGDIGGTKTQLGLFEPAPVRPRRVTVRTYGTLDYSDLPAMIAPFLDDASIERARVAAACFGVAGPVIDGAAALTNVPWRVEAKGVQEAFGFGRVDLLNDLQAMAYSVPVLSGEETVALQDGKAVEHGNIAVIAAGTGLGEAMLNEIGGRWVPSPSEAGHADFSARTEREITLLRDLTSRYGRADIEHVISGRGFANIHRVMHPDGCRAGVDIADPTAPAAITAAALERRCAGCVDTLDLFVEAYGAEAGNLALRSMATGGVFIGGGIAPKILSALTNGAFVRAFAAKAPLDAMLREVPVKVILNDEAGLLGAAVYANSIGHERQ